MAMFKPTVLSPEGAQQIADHKYVPGHYTPLDNILNPFWFNVAECLPMWLAPNLVTLLGILPMGVVYGLTWYSSPDFSEPPSRGLALFSTIALFFYQTMDAVDGKQARRTGASSPMGQLFDHGLDCLVCLACHSMAAMLMIPGASMWTLAGLTGLQTVHFLAQWREYHTGVLSTAVGVVGWTEVQFGLMGGVLLIAIVGPEMIKTVFTHSVQLPWSSQPVTVGVIGSQGWALLCTSTAVTGIVSTIQVAAANGGLGSAVAQLVSIGSIVTMGFLVEPSCFAAHARMFVFLTGLNMFFLQCKMILFSMAKMHYSTFHWDSLLPFAAVVASSWMLPPGMFYYVLAVITVGFCTRVALWEWAVLDELAVKLRIHVFSVKKRD